MKNETRLVISKIDRNLLRQDRPSLIHVTVFDALGRETFRFNLPASKFKGDLKVGQELLLAPVEFFVVSS